MQIITSVQSIRKTRGNLSKRSSVGFVPTMGALHEGHLSLIRRSKRENDIAIVSIFVNPIQFGPGEDYDRYPRPFHDDVKLLASLGVDVLFAPQRDQMILPGNLTRIQVAGLREKLCGSPQFRGPGHFDGVATIVAKLFHLIRPHKAYFGLKDYQQVRVIEQMVADLNLDVGIVRCPTIREADGVAMSSRNRYLSVEDRGRVSLFFDALQHGRKLLTSDQEIDGKSVCQRIKARLMKIPPSKIDYVSLVDAETLEPVRSMTRPAVLAAAIHIKKTRLIDNIIIDPHEKKVSC